MFCIQDDQRQLFHEFTQFKADKLQNGQGSGLGLWSKSNIIILFNNIKIN